MTDQNPVTQNPVREKLTLKILIIAVAGCLLYGILSGFRSDMSVIIGIINASSNSFSYTDLQIANTISRFVTAFASMIMGFLVLKRSNFFVLTLGFVLTLSGLVCIMVANNLAVLIIGLGYLFSFGTAALSFGIIFGILSPLVGEKTAIILSTMMTISSSFFGVVFSPLIQYCSDTFGYQVMLGIFCMVILCSYPLVFLISGKKCEAVIAKEKERIQISDALLLIIKNRITYILMLICFAQGFIISEMTNHYYTWMISLDVSSMQVSLSYSFISVIMAVSTVVFSVVVLKVKRPLAFGSLVFFFIGMMMIPAVFLLNEALYFFIFLLLVVIIALAVTPLSSLITIRAFSPVLVGPVLCFTTFIFTKAGAGLNGILGGIIFETVGNFELLVIFEIVTAFIVSAVLFVYVLKSKDSSVDKRAEEPKKRGE